MKYNTIKARLALKTTEFGLLFFLISLGIHQLMLPLGRIASIMISTVFFGGGILASAYIAAAQELWVFKRLADSRDQGDAWQDLSEENLPEEVTEVRGVLNSLKTGMEEAILSQRRFLADASHEMRSPITIMKGNIEIALRRERDVGEYKGVLTSNLEEIDRLEYLLKDLMFLARTDANELLMNMAPMNLEDVLQTVFEGLSPLAGRKGIELNIDLKCPQGCRMEGDADRLRQLFINLVENAIRYTPSGGKVNIELTKVTGINKVVIADTGIGIPEAELPKIFDRFYRVEKARSREMGGTGLGLCICKWIVDAHKGDIYIESEEGVGTRVTVMLL
ncbi:MAG TPA: ATP-binding protein [Nitrospirota bacterium]|jgi:signal transduction histidine kinase